MRGIRKRYLIAFVIGLTFISWVNIARTISIGECVRKYSRNYCIALKNQRSAYMSNARTSRLVSRPLHERKEIFIPSFILGGILMLYAGIFGVKYFVMENYKYLKEQGVSRSNK